MSLPRFLLVTILLAINADADFIVLRNNQVLSGKVFHEAANELRLERPKATNRYPAITVIFEYSDGGGSASGTQLPSLGWTINHAVALDWAHDMRQIPATVIDRGPLRRVPYMSFRCGIDYEINIYGDPEKPACVEVGFYLSLLKEGKAYENCKQLFVQLFKGTPAERQLSNLDNSTALKVAGNWTVEVTEPDAPDSYGGWWISVYSEPALNASRASTRELTSVTEPKSRTGTRNSDDFSWTADDLRYARPVATVLTPRPKADVSPPSSGTVYVRGYTRKDGTYVRPHTRRRR